MNSVLTCSRYVVRAFLTGVYNSAGGPGPLDPHQGGSVASGAPIYSCSALGTNNFANSSSTFATSTKASESGSSSSNSSSESLELTSKPKFVSAKCGFPKQMMHGPSTAREQEVFGDDACFIATHRSADVVGVADGVGGWHGYGIDPSLFARGLMRICGDLVRSGQFRPHLPAQLLASAYYKLQHAVELESAEESCEEEERAFGSSTACVVVLDKLERKLHTANLGDSGFVVVRDGKVVYQSEEQIHYFNTPFQLSLPPKEMRLRSNFLSDSPESAETTSFAVKEGDIILVATDGLFDNLPTSLIEKELGHLKNLHDEMNLQEVCNSLALQARRLAFDMEFMSPFAKKAQSYGIQTSGGKPDDVTVVLAVVSSEECKNNNIIRQNHHLNQGSDVEKEVECIELPSRELLSKNRKI